MSNYYHRDNEGNWSISSHGILIPFEYSASMEIAFQMGRADKVREEIIEEKIREEMVENLMLARDTQFHKMDDSPI